MLYDDRTAPFDGVGSEMAVVPMAMTFEVGMRKQNAVDAEKDAKLGRRVKRQVSVLLTETEKEDIPDRLLDAARDLQKAIDDKADDRA